MSEILYVTNVRLPTHRAHGLQIMKVCEAFKRTGANVRLIAPALKPSVPEDPFRYYGIAARFPLYKIPVIETVRPGMNGRWSAYVQNTSFAVSALLFLIFRGWFWGDRVYYTRDYTTALMLVLTGRKTVFEIHDYRPEQPNWRVRAIVQRARLIIANSEGTLDALRAHYAVDISRTLVAPNGVDPAFYAISQTPAEARTAFGIPQGARVIAYVGRLETVGLEKGVSILLQAFAAIRAQRDDVFLAVVGGPASMVERYRRQADETGIPNDSVLFTGQVPYTSIPVLLRAIDIAVIPFPATKQLATTASPIKVFEFMAAGKAILASDLPSLRRYLNTQNAVFFEPSNVVDLAEQLQNLINNWEHAQSLGMNALHDVAKYTWEARAKGIIIAIP